MGRIDEALRRAGTSGAPALEHEGGGDDTSAPASPWVFTTDEVPRRSRDEAPVQRRDEATVGGRSADEVGGLGPGEAEELRSSGVEGPGPSEVEGLGPSKVEDPAPGAVEEPRGSMLSHAPRVHRTRRRGAEPGDLAVFRGFNPAVLDRLVVNDHATPALAEQFRKLAATLHHAQLSDGIKVIMVTSGMASDGKTLTATNLALTLSESYRRDVLLVDADLRRPSLHEIFQVPNVSGLNEGLQADTDEKLSTLRVTDTLTLLPAGRPNADPMSSLTSGRMRGIIEEAATSFHWVILDTPPVGLLADANLLVDMVDGALLVVLAERTPYKAVRKAVDTVGRDRILGVVLNGSMTREQTEYYERRYSA